MPDEVIDGKTFDIIETSKEIEPISIPNKLDVDSAVELYRAQREFVTRIMEQDRDYGTVPGTNKPSLWKPGAEKFHRFYGFQVEVKVSDKIENWDTPVSLTTFPLFSYTYECIVKDRYGSLIATAEGNCNSYESKYQWRWVNIAPSKYKLDHLETRPGTEVEFKFAIEKKETTGAYGKPAEYWQSWEEDIEKGIAVSINRKTRTGKYLDAYERDASVYRIPNEDIYSQVNTIMKMAQKRAYVGGVLLASNASEYFTQDLEDHADIEEKPSIYTFVPDKNAAGMTLRRHVAKISGLGIAEAGYFIKYYLESNMLEWTLDEWALIVENLESAIKEGQHDKKEAREWINSAASGSSD